MSKKNQSTFRTDASKNKQSPWALPVVGLLVVAFIVGAIMVIRQRSSPSANMSEQPKPTPHQSAPAQTLVAQPSASAASSSQVLSMEVAKAVMVTAELSNVQNIPAALTQIERRYVPDDGVGRTFAILDASGVPKSNGKLHISMHVSSEKPGRGSLVFNPTGEVLWDSRITAGPTRPPAKSLNIYIADETDASWIIDGSGNPVSILDAKVRDKGIKVRDFWPDGSEREATFVYSACGCPVKAMVRRVGERTVRTNELPIMFPDDPGGLQTIANLMRW
jgi:hypothetical protein